MNPAVMHEERGSLPLAMLAVIIVAALITVVTASVVAGSRQTAFDAGYEEALQTAESGIGQFISAVKNPSAVTLAACTTNPQPNARCIPATASGPGQFEVRGESDVQGNWVIVATGQVRGVERIVRVELERQIPFQYALFTDANMTFNGSARNARSYNSKGASPWGGATGTSNAVFAGNGVGNAFDLAGASCGSTLCGNIVVQDADVDVASDDAVAFITDELATCTATVLPASPIPPGTYCVGNLNLNGTVRLQDVAAFDPDDPAQAVRILVTGNIYVGRNASVNCVSEAGTNVYEKCTWGAAAPNIPEPGALQIYSIGEGQVTFDNSARIAAAIYAPRSHCLSMPHAQVFGALVCRSAGTFTGHFRLYYDEALRDLTGPERRIWSEEPNGA